MILAILIAGTLEDHGRLDAALVAYRKARELKPDSRIAAVGEMRILDLEGKYAEAATSLTQLFAFEPDDVALYAQVMRLFDRALHRPL